MLDLRRARVTGSDVWGIEGVRWTRLTDGDRYRSERWQPVFAPDKQRVAGADGPCEVTPSEDVFYNYELVVLAEGLADQTGCASVGGVSWEDDPQWAAELTRGRGFAAYRAGGSTSGVARRPRAT